MDVSPNSRANNPRKRTRLITLGVVALLIAVLWWRAPARYRYVSSYPALAGSGVRFSDLGFVVREEGKTTYIMRDWRGQERWRVTLAKEMDWCGWSNNIDALHAALSPDGHIFAVFYYNKRFTPRKRVQIWRDGVPEGDLTLPLSDHDRSYVENVPNVQFVAQNSGRVLCDVTPGPPGTNVDNILYVIEKSRILARHQHAGEMLLAPDGATAITNRQECDTLGIHADHLVLTKRYALQNGLLMFDLRDFTMTSQHIRCLYIGGGIITFNGAMFDGAGRKIPLGAWSGFEASTNGQYALQSAGNQRRVLCPATGAAWAFPAPSGVIGESEPTSDGQHALLRSTLRLPPAAQPLLRLLPALRAPAAQYLQPSYLTLYRRPGTVVARMRLPRNSPLPLRMQMIQQSVTNAPPVLTPRGTQILSYWPSFDGRAVLFLCEGGTVELYRW